MGLRGSGGLGLDTAVVAMADGKMEGRYRNHGQEESRREGGRDGVSEGKSVAGLRRISENYREKEKWKWGRRIAAGMLAGPSLISCMRNPGSRRFPQVRSLLA